MEALADIVPELAAAPRTTVVMACGTGKTILAAGAADRLGPARIVLVVVPTLALLGQTAAAWTAVRDRSVIAVCSDDEVLSGNGLPPGLPVTTKPVEIAAQVQTADDAVVLCTYASMWAVAEAHRSHGMPAWDLVVVDEAHRTAGQLGKPWGQIHDDGQIPADKRLYMTATPRYFDTGRSVAVSMDDEALFGRVCHTLPFDEAIRRGLLTDYRVVVPLITDAELLVEAAAKYLAAGEAVDAQALTLAVAVLKAARAYGMTRVISYHSRIADAKEFVRAVRLAAEVLAEDGQEWDVRAREIHGRQTPGMRARLIEDLRHSTHDLDLLANVKVLAEGVDIPAVDGVVFAYAKTSMPDIIQAVGRALRLHGDNADATIVIPVLVPESMSAETVVADSAYEGLWSVLQALRAYDERLTAKAIVAAFQQQDERPDGLDDAGHGPRIFVEATHIPDGFAHGIEVKLLDVNATGPWFQGYIHARALFAQRGDLDVTVSYKTADGYPLGLWLRSRRADYNRGKLKPERIRYLEELGIAWDRFGRLWAEAVAVATAHSRANGGRLEVGKEFFTADGYPLGAWLGTQRAKKRKGTLTGERIAELDALGMVWGVERTRSARWERGCAAAAAYRAEHGDLLVHDKHVDADGFKLGQWIAERRKQYLSAQLSVERIAELEALSMVWAVKDTAWEAHLDAARAHLDAARGPAGVD